MSEQNRPRRGRPPIPGLIKKNKVNLTLDPSLIEIAKKGAEDRRLSLSQLVTLAIEKELERELAKEKRANIVPLERADEKVVPMPQRSHITAAAGSPLGAEVEEWDDANDIVRVRISGLSMVPLFNDGDVIAMNHKRGARSQFMKKGLIYLVEYKGGYTVKRYNTRPATPEEIEEGISYVSKGDNKTKVRVLESLNPEFPEIVIKDEADWVAWFDPKKKIASL